MMLMVFIFYTVLSVLLFILNFIYIRNKIKQLEIENNKKLIKVEKRLEVKFTEEFANFLIALEELAYRTKPKSTSKVDEILSSTNNNNNKGGYFH